MGHNKAGVGDWITLEPGVPLDMEVIIGEGPGGGFAAMLAVEVQGVEYEKGPQGNPILPIFKTTAPSLDMVETIHADLVPGEVCVTNGPIFCDYESSGQTAAWEPESHDPPIFADSVEEETRLWTLDDGKSMEATFATMIGDKVVLTDSRDRQRTIPFARLSEEDRRYVKLAKPPKFKIDFFKRSNQRFFKNSPYSSAAYLPKQADYVFGARLKQTSAGRYNYELRVEFFAIGEEIDGDNYILLDRQESRFTPTEENGRSCEFHGETVQIREKTIPPYASIFGQRRGDKYGGYLVLVTDEHGMIVDYGASSDWLLNIVGQLRQFSVGKHFDKTGARVCPPRPKPIGIY